MKNLIKSTQSFSLTLMILFLTSVCFGQGYYNPKPLQNNAFLIDQEKSKPLYVDNQYHYYSPEQLMDVNVFRSILRSDVFFLDSVESPSFLYCYDLDTFAWLGTSSWDSLIGISGDKELFFDYILQKNIPEIQQMDSLVREQRSWLRNTILSDAYLERMFYCTKANSIAFELQKLHLSYLDSGEYYFSNHTDLSGDSISGHAYSYGSRPVFLHYCPQKSFESDGLISVLNKIGVKPLKSFKEFDPMQVFEYQINSGNIPKFIVNQFMIAFSEKRFLSRYDYHGSFNFDYYSDPIQILARKRVLDYEMELRGIKNYSDEFTEDHYEKIKFLSDRGFLSDDANKFFYMFHKRHLIWIMNRVP